MTNKFRLKSSAFEREKEEEKEEPAKVFFLSVEGNDTEKEYFRKVSEYRRELGINALVDVKVLERAKNDTKSAPQYVIELLEEYIQLRGSSAEQLIDRAYPLFSEKYTKEQIADYLGKQKNLTLKEVRRIESDLMILGCDLNYQQYLSKYNSEYDEFCIIIDRDKETHSEENMKDCIAHCKKNHYLCYITNPCFEFWLLLHLCNVKEEFKGQIEKIKVNAKVSGRHSFVSNEISQRGHHNKSHIKFEENYLYTIDQAIERANDFETKLESLIDNVGTNIGELFERLRKQVE